MFKERLYGKLPICFQNFLVSREGARIQRLRFGQNFHEILREYESRLRWSPEEIRNYSRKRFEEFFHDCTSRVPFYKGNSSDLNSLPVLSKSEVRENLSAIAAPLGREERLTVHTSGTTGAGLVFPTTLRAHREQWAVWWRFRRAHGISLETPCLYFGGRSVVPIRQKTPPYWRYNKPARQILFSAYHLNDRTAPAYLQEMIHSRAPWIHGYPSMVAVIARYSLDLGLKLQPTWVTLGAESVLPYQEAVIREAFGVSPLQHYGMAEGVANASMCRHGKLHLDEDFSFVDLVALKGDQYRICGTNFINSAFPLIRYDTGDIATVSINPCSCGWPGRLVTAIDGRVEDYVTARDGTQFGRLDHAFKDATRIKEAQIRQSIPGYIIVLIVRAPGYSADDEKAVARGLKERLGDHVDFEISYVNEIEKGESGKHRFVMARGTMLS